MDRDISHAFPNMRSLEIRVFHILIGIRQAQTDISMRDLSPTATLHATESGLAR